MKNETDVDWAAGYLRAHENAKEATDVTLDVIEGSIPASMRGVLFRNGPGRFECGGVPYGHVFDGDGFLVRFAFEQNRVLYRSRFVRTKEFIEEENAGRILYRGFGTNIPGGVWKNAFDLKFKNAANTSVAFHSSKLLALWEGGVPYEIDPATLSTIGPWDGQGNLVRKRNLLTPITGKHYPFSAHPRRDLDRGAMLNFGSVVDPRGAKLMQYEIDSEGRMSAPNFVQLSETVFLHDFVVTPTYRAYLLCKTVLDMKTTLLGKTTVETGLQFTNAPTIVLLVPRSGGDPIRLEMPPCFVFHFTNAFEDGRHVVIDGFKYLEYPRLPGPRDKIERRDRNMGPFFTRFIIDPDKRVVTEESLGQNLGELPSIHPSHHGRPYRFAWSPSTPVGSDRTNFTGIARFDTTAKTSTYRELDALVGEALFVPNPGGSSEDDGWVTTLAYVPEVHRSDLFILDARTLDTVCRLRLPHHVPPGFHGTWAPAAASS
ncbi:MAG: carotenoid oxygenase family protein [Polyangiaceae bacterium]|nr:carotenoid oxygenase family protein [Polyangiaceae bacterium]